MGKFKVGDRVKRVIDTGVGRRGAVTAIVANSRNLYVQWDGEPQEVMYGEEALKPAPDKLLTTKEHTEAHGDKIKGYKKLDDEAIALINEIKSKGLELQKLHAEVSEHIGMKAGIGDISRRLEWANYAKKDLQVGLMELIRAVADPEGF